MYVCICKYKIFGLIIRKYIQICLVVPSRKQSFGGISQDFPCSISRAQTAPRKRHADAELQTKRRLASYGMLGYAMLRSSVTDTPPLIRFSYCTNLSAPKTRFIFYLIPWNTNTVPIAEILSGKNPRAWVSMVLYLKN